MCSGRGAPPDRTEVLAFTDAHVVPVRGGYADAAVPVPPGTDLCFDTSGVDAAVASLAVLRVGLGDAGLRCTLGRECVTQADTTGGLFTATPGTVQTRLAAMDLLLAAPVLSCEEGISWLVAASDSEGTVLAYRILDPCVGVGETLVVIDATEPTLAEVVADVEAATTLSVEAGIQYTLDWTALSTDAFGAPVVPEDLYIVVVADLSADVPLDKAVLAPAKNADSLYELWAHPDATVRDLGEAYTGPGFPGFEAGHSYLLGFSPPQNCIQASVIATVQVAAS